MKDIASNADSILGKRYSSASSRDPYGSHDGETTSPKLIQGKRNTAEYDVTFTQLIKHLELLAAGGESCEDLYIYRGQSKSEYDLQPSAMREGECENLWLLDSAIREWKTELKEIQGSGCKSDYETNPMNRAMRLFFTLASRQGLDLPPQIVDRNLLIDPSRFVIITTEKDGTTDGAYLELSAVAQHYGFPTMLLDWSLDPLCAVYFAVQGALEGLASRDEGYDLLNGFFSVFALKASRFNWGGPQIMIRTYTHHSNRNLVAQKGLFTYVFRKKLDD